MDEFQSFTKGLSSPETKHFAIVPDDNTDLPIIPRVIYCETGGTIVIRDEAGVSLSYTLISEDRIDFRGIRVLSTGTYGTYYGWS